MTIEELKDSGAIYFEKITEGMQQYDNQIVRMNEYQAYNDDPRSRFHFVRHDFQQGHILLQTRYLALSYININHSFFSGIVQPYF